MSDLKKVIERDSARSFMDKIDETVKNRDMNSLQPFLPYGAQ